MITKVVTFYGSNTDRDGMPQSYNSYFVVSSAWAAVDSAVAQILVLSGDARPTKTRFLVVKGGPDAAYGQARESLKRLPANADLKIHVGD